VVVVFDKAERLPERVGGSLLDLLLSLPSHIAGPLDRDGCVLPIFVSEALWPNYLSTTDFRRLTPVLFRGYSKAQLTTVMKRDVSAIAGTASEASGQARPSQLRRCAGGPTDVADAAAAAAKETSRSATGAGAVAQAAESEVAMGKGEGVSNVTSMGGAGAGGDQLGAA